MSHPAGEVAIVPLLADHIAPLVQAHASAPAGYHQYFTPFPFDQATWDGILATRQQDGYFAVLVGGDMAGVYMLRGLDAGYTIPAYGVWISHTHQGRGLATATLHHAVAHCRALGCETLMLKVHPDNRRAKNLYERFGFQPVGVDPSNDNLIYHFALAAPA